MVRSRKSRAVGAGLLAAAATAIAPAAAQDVLTYHNSANRSGLYVASGLTSAVAAGVHLDTAFSAAVSGSVYAQPLYWQPTSGAAEVIVATENNFVYALDAVTGAQIWSTLLAPPVPLSDLPCGDIDPRGVTGTPVIDPATATLYVEASALTSAGPRHQVFALSLATGKPVVNWPVDVSVQTQGLQIPFNNGPQGQRSALTLVSDRLFVPYAGLAGDCGVYSGMLVGFSTQRPGVFGAWATKIRGGGSWGVGGAAYDGAALYLTTGNSFPRYGANQTAGQGWGGEEAVLRLQTTLADPAAKADYFAPANWIALDAADLDLGGTSAIPIDVPVAGKPSAPRVLALGKDGKAYLLNRQNLGGIGGQIAVTSVSGNSIVNAIAAFPQANAAVAVVGASCSGGNLLALTVTASAVSPAWCANYGGNGSPIVTTTDGASNPLVWALGAEGDSKLYGFDGATGKLIVAASSGGAGFARWVTPIWANGRFYAAANGAVYAFTY